MFGLLKKQNPYEQAAESVYERAMESARDPAFFEKYGVPDSFDGRFDLLLLHIFLVLNRMLEDDAVQAEQFNQALFDQTFKNMDQTLRMIGIGDMGVPKHMRRMMKAFNGRMHAYKEGLEAGTFSEALERNLYGTCKDLDPKVSKTMEKKVLEMIKTLKNKDSATIAAGEIQFKG